MTNNPLVNDPHILDGYGDGADLLGYDDGAGLLGYEIAPPVPGLFDPSTDPLGGPVGERVYLVTATLYPDWTNQAPPSGEGAINATAAFPTAGFPFGASAAAPVSVDLRLASMRFATRVDDPTLPSIGFDDRIIDPGSLNLSLPLTPVGASAIESTIGSIVLDNSDADFDTVLDQATAISQSIRIRAGRRGAYLNDFVTICDARITGVGMTEEEATIELQDPVLYAQNLYPTSIYTGAGGATGDAELEGVVKPIVLGRVWNMGPVLINATSLIYQAHDGAISAVTGVFDGGVALTPSANYASYAALAGASVSPGSYATCLAAGLLRVGGTPAYALTAHIDGSASAGTTLRSIASWLIGQIDSLLDLTVDGGSFTALPAWTAGWVWTSPFTFAEAISRFVGDGGFCWGSDTDGTVRALKLLPPDAGSATASYGTASIVHVERTSLPSGYEGIHQRQQVLYARNWTVQDDAALAASAIARAGRQREWRTALATVASTSRNAIDPAALETSLASAADAASLAGYLLGLHGVSRQMYSLETGIFGTLPKVGDTVIATYPRFGLSGGKAMRVVGNNLALGDGAMKLLLWG